MNKSMNTCDVFISRELSPQSKFHSLELSGKKVCGRSLITIKPEAFDFIPNAEWYFFYSVNGVHHFFSQINKEQKDKIASKKIATIGPKTAQSLEQYINKPIDFIGENASPHTALRFIEKLTPDIVCFIQAKHSNRSIQKFLAKDKFLELTVYDNTLNVNIAIPDALINCFTSTLNVESYFQKKQPKSNNYYLAIGPTTAKSLSKYIESSQIIIASESTEESLFISVIQLIKTFNNI